MRPTTERSAEVEYRLLTTDEGSALIEKVGIVSKPSPADLTRWRKTFDAESVSAALRIVETRRRGAAKFSKADQMWFEPTALEQSTSELVAKHKARRFVGETVTDLCCGIGGDAIALAGESKNVVAVDCDLGMLKRLNFNARVYECGDRLLCVKSRAESFSSASTNLVHIDPDRRSSGKGRASKIMGYSPDLTALHSLIRNYEGGAIKLGPASDFSEHFGSDGQEIEVVSLDGECKEATVWFGSLATCSRRATTLPDGATWTGTSGSRTSETLEFLGRYIYEPNAALIRSGLLDHFAFAHGLFRYLDGVDILTGDSFIQSPFLSGFCVYEEMRLDLRMVRMNLRGSACTASEVKTRGLGGTVAEDALREFQNDGAQLPVTVFLLRGSNRSRAVVARRV